MLYVIYNPVGLLDNWHYVYSALVPMSLLRRIEHGLYIMTKSAMMSSTGFSLMFTTSMRRPCTASNVSMYLICRHFWLGLEHLLRKSHQVFLGFAAFVGPSKKGNLL
jgi:hypothetical protein